MSRGGVDVQLYSFFNFGADGVCAQHHAQLLYPREIPGTRCSGGWVGPRAGLDGTLLCLKVKVKVQFNLEHANKSKRGSRGTALLFL